MGARLLTGIITSRQKQAGNDFENALNVVGDVTEVFGEVNENGAVLHDAVLTSRLAA